MISDKDKLEAPYIQILEKFVERPDGVYYLWKQSHEKEWHEKLTGHKETPYVKFKWMHPIEFNEFKKKQATNQAVFGEENIK